MTKQVMPIAHVKVDICKFCEHEYITPCHGENQECENRRFIEGGGKALQQRKDPVPIAPVRKGKGKGKGAKVTPRLREVQVMDMVDAPACSCCKTSAWMVDSDGAGKFWLTCTDPEGNGCDERRELPEDVRVMME